MSPLSKDQIGRGSSILQRNIPISLIWLQCETAWLAALLLFLHLLCINPDNKTSPELNKYKDSPVQTALDRQHLHDILLTVDNPCCMAT